MTMARPDLGPTFEALPFTPGRHALAVQRTTRGTHARQVFSEDSTALFLLDLDADGAASAVRGWRYLGFNDGPEVSSEDRLREQQGYRGRYQVRDGLAEVELGIDDSVCPPVREHLLVPRRSAVITLRCVRAAPRGQHDAVLLCQGRLDTGELAPFLEPELGPEGWFVLGRGNGLRVWITGAPRGLVGSPRAVRVERAASPVERDAWERAF
jgi:hypothetical protein